MYNEEDRKWLYEQMKQSGVDTGSYDDFKQSLNNQEDREWYYNKSKELKLDVGSQQDFDDMMVEPVAAQPQQPASPAPTPMQPAQSTPINGYKQPQFDASKLQRPDQRTDLEKTFDMIHGQLKQANQQQAQENDEFWRNDPTMQQRQQYNQRNGIALDPTVPSDQRGIRLGVQRPSALDMGNPRYASIIKNDEAVNAGMDVFGKELQRIEEAGRQHLKDAAGRNTPSTSPDGYLGPDMATMREASEISDPSLAIQSAVDQMTAQMLQDDYFTTDGENLNDAGRYALQTMQQRMIQQLVEKRMPQSSAEYIVLNAIRNSDFGKLTRMATSTPFQNYLDDLAAQSYQPGFWEKVGTGALTFGLNMPEYALTGAAGGGLSKFMTGGLTKIVTNGLVRRGVERSVAERAAQMVMSNTLTGRAAQIGSTAVHGATTFGLQPVIGTPVDLTYKAGQPINPDGSAFTPELDDYIGETWKEMKKGAAMGTLMVGGAVAAVPEKIAQGAVKEGLIRGALGFGYDAGVMAGFSLHDMKEADPTFEITPESAAEAYAESAASLGLLKLPHMFGMKGQVEQARQAQKFKFTPEEKQYLRDMGIDDPVELALRMANRGAEQPSFLKSILRNDERTPQAQTGKEIVKDDAEPIDAENMQQLSAAYRSFMASEAPETMKAKVMYLIEGKMPAQFSPVTGTRIVEDGSKIYVETLNQRGGVIERKPMRSYEEALAEQNRLGFQADMNTTEAIQNRLDELETATDMSNMLTESYEAIRRKAVSDPDKLTAEDRDLLSMAQNIPAILQKANGGTELTPSEQSLLNSAFSRLNAYKQKNGAGKRIAAEVEDMYDLNVGEVERAMYGHSKAEAEELAGGNGIVEIGNGIYRTEQEQQIVSEYRQRMLQRIQEHEALRQTETEAQTQEGTVQQPVDTSRMIEGEVPQEPVAETPPPPADTEGDNGGGESKYTAPSFDIETSRQRGRDAYYTQDQPTIKSIGHEMKMADVRMFRYFPSEEAMRIDEAVKTGNLESIDTESMTVQQRDAFVKYVNAYAEAEGFKAAMDEHHQQQAALDEAAIEPYRNEAGEIIPLTLDNGQQAYHKSGDLANKFGTVTVTYTDETGQPKTTNWPVSKIKEQGTAMPAGQFAERLSADLAEQSGNRVMNWLLGNNVEAGQQVELTIAGETIPFTVDGFYPDGDIQLSDGDGNIMKMTKEEVLNMMEATDQLQIETQLQQEAAQFREAQRQQREADRQAEIAQRTERYNNGIVGMKEGNPDFTAEGSDPAVVAEYLLGASRQQEQTIAEVKPQVINDIQQSKDELKTRQTEARQELSRVISQLSVGKDILDTDEAQQLEQRQAELEAELQDLDARQRRWADVRSNLMTKEEVQQFETERRSDVSQARKGLRPAEQNRNFGQNDEHIAVNEDGTMNFGLTPTGNANNYLLRHFQDSFDAEKFMNDQRIALRNKQRDEVQPQIDALNGQLNDYISGRIELTPEELKQISQSVTDLEAYQDALTREASHMREIVEGISELYERNGRNEPSTPQEQRMEAMSKARSAQDKLRIAREIYKDDPQAISAINDMEPRDIAEYISQNLGRGTINWEGFDRGDHHVRGLREELGSGWERGISRGKSTNAFNMYLAAEGQGKGIEEIVHDLYEAQPDIEGSGKMYSTEDLRNGIIDLLSTARTPSDISHLTINNRIAEAEQYVRAMEEYEEREAELAELGMPDNDAIREWIPSVSEQEYTPEVIAYLDGAFADYIESLGGDRETYEDAMRQLAADEELTFNEIAEYERNEPAADGQRPSGTSNRVDEKPVTAGVPEGSNQGKEDLSATQAHDNDGHPAIEAGQPQQSAPESGTAGSGESLAVQPQGGIEKGKKSNIQGLETYSEDEILNQVRDYFDVVRGDNDADAEIVGMKIIGSRTNGTANDDSDLDVLLEYKGKAREDDLFNMLSGTDEPLTIEGIRVDINPITKGKSGTIEEFMRRNADYRKETPAVFKDRLETAKADTNTEPTEAQKKAGNYKMGHVEFGGYKMSIENPKGSVRSGVDQNGKPWSIEMKDTYGYIGKKYGADGDHLDFFINDDADLDNFNGRVYVVDQKNEDGTFDEHKVMYGYPTWGEAKKAYERNYEPGWWDKHVMQMLGVPKDRFDKWLSDSDRKTKPYADYFRLKYDNPISDPIEEVKANIRERQNSIMDQVKQSASVVQARAEAAIQKKEPTLKPADIKSMTDDELQKSRKKRSSVASTARFLLGTTNIEKGSEKWNTLQETIRQQQADMDAIDDELQSRRERSREELENVLTDRETGGALVEHLQDMGIDVTTDVRENRRIRKQAENDQSENGELRRMHTPDGKTYGFAYRGKLYLDPRKIDGKLPIHEYAHLWSEALRKLNPESWNNVVSLIKADADTWRFVQERNPEITDENALVEEVIATASGERGQERLKAEYERMSKRDGNYTSKWGNIWKNISKALQDFWKQVTDFLHINYKSAAQVYDQVLKDFVDGVNPRRKVEDWLERRNNDYMEAVQKGEKEKASAIFMEALKEEVGNGITPFVAVDKYRNVSSLAKRVKSRDAEAVREDAEMMKPLIPENAVLVPVPSHTGEATDMLDVAKVLGELTGSEVADVLKGAPRASQYDTKKETGAAISSSDLGIRMEGQLPEGKLPIIIDNVVDTGNTAEACVQALGRGVVVSLGRSVDDTRHAATLKSADPIVTNRRGDVVPLDERFDLGGSKYMFRPYEDMASEPVPEREVASVVKMEPKSQTDTEKREAKVRQAATKAVLSALDNAGVKYKVVSQEEANQMMSIYAAVNEEPIVTRAKKFRPDWHKRYAVVNTLDPYAVPQYFEKKRLALEHTKWANRGNGKKYTMVDMGYPDEVAGGLSNAAQIAEMIQPMIGWHGSGAVFTVFDHSHMGEGQGSQMFGWGTYLSNSRRIGEDYADMSGEGWKYKNKSRKEVLAGKGEMPEGRYNRDEELVADIMRQMEYGRTFEDAQARLIKDIDTDIKNLEENISDLSEGDLKDLQGFKDEKSFVESLNAEDFTKKPANLYKVEIPEDTGSNYLDWMTTIKKPLRKKIADAVRKLDGEPAQSVVYANYKEGWQTIANLIEREPLAYKEIHDRLLQAFGGRLADAEKVSKLMSEAGFTGVKYPAGTIMGDGDGATNYVIFNENDAKITEHIQFMFEEPEVQEQTPIFISNALKAVEGIKQEKATPEQWLKMIEKNGGLKAGEDKWLGLSDWMKEQQASGKKSVTRQEIEDYIRQNQIEIEETHYSEMEGLPEKSQQKMDAFQQEFNDLMWEGSEATNSIFASDWVDYAFSKMEERYGEDFRSAFDIVGTGTQARLEPTLDYDDNLSQAAAYYLEFENSPEMPIDSTRLSYTTHGLENKKEIALTVPTIEPWNEGDQIHFGDAGGGRAIAWIRFGDADYISEEIQHPVSGEPTKVKVHKKVLVIDEIQSKRHQEGREKGYKPIPTAEQKKRYDEAESEYREALRANKQLNKELSDKYGEPNSFVQPSDLFEPDDKGGERWKAQFSPEDLEAYNKAKERLEKASEERRQAELPSVDPFNRQPSEAPFEKNWHELAMKRMLRYAAENGYDAVAWTKGEQQGERYNLGQVVDAVDVSSYQAESPSEVDGYDVTIITSDRSNIELFVTKDGIVSSTEHPELHDKPLSDILGKPMAERILSEDGGFYQGEDLRVGIEGMKGFYDDILPRFMNKYGKKWGMKVGEVDLPDLSEPNTSGKVQRGLTMWSVDVTPEMKESVMQGQPMFQKGQNGKIYGWTDGQQIYLTEAGLNPNTPVHEYTHIWAKYIMKSDPELWKTIVSTMKKTDMWKQIEKNKNYKGIWENDDQMASEVLSRLSGATSEEEFMKAAATKKGSKAIIDQVKSVLRRFWEAVKRLFGSTGKTIGNVTNSWQSIVRMPLRDLLEGVNPVGEETGTMAQRGDIVQKTLMGVHNISEVKLRKALKQGGLANPSLAVIDTKNGMHNDYGEISLIPKSSLIDSKKGRNAGTFAGDAWTPTYPQVEKIMSDKGLDAYYKDVRNVSENRELTGQLKMVWENYLDGSDPGRLAYWYLKEKGIEPENSYFDSGYTEEQRKRFAEITDNGSKGFLDMNDEERSGVIAMIAEKEGISLEEKLAKYQALRNKNAEILAKGEKKPFTKILQRTIEEIDKYGITLTPVSDFLYGMKKAINSDGKLNVGGTLQNARDRMQADGMEADFNRWLEEKEQKYGVKEMLFDGFTRDGDRKYIPNTLQNASRMMNREADANSGGQTGFGASRAMLLGKMQSLADIRKQKGKLHGIDEDTQQRYDEASDEMFEVVKALSNMQKISDNPFSNVDYANARLNEALQQKDPISYLNKEFGYNIEKDGDFAKGLKTMLQNVEDLPVKYFETKFKRPVMLDEFTVAIVPENTSAEVVKALQDAGLDVRTYDNTGDEAIRNENRRLATMEAVGMRDDILFHIEDDTETVKRLDSEPTEIGYRNVVLNDDGSLGSPMANRLGKKGVARRPTTMFAFDKWERSDENPDLATEDGKIDLIKPGNKEVGGVDYNPYIHIRPTLVNKQFKQAWERPNLVYIRTKYPVSELDGGYKAEKAKLSVGKHPWGGGELILSRWDKPQEIVPWEEVADDWVKEFQGEKGIHFDIIPPKLLPILVERGMNILPPHKGMGKKCMEAYEKFKSETIRRMAANGNSDASKGRFLFDGESVIDVIGTEFQKSDKSIVDTVSKFFMEEYGGEANRQDIGKILLDKRAVKNDIGHGLNRIKAATFAAVHDIIEQGVIIDKKNEWKGKQTESYIIAAPITIAGERYVGMAIVKRAVDGKRLYLHGVITQKSLQDEALKTDPKVERRQGDVAKILINLHKAKENAKKLQKGGENHQKMIDEVNREAENLGGVKVNIVSSDDIKDENMRHEMHMGTKGIYDPNTGEVSLLVDNIDSIDEAKRVVFHEKLGHEGLKALLGSNEAVMKFGNFLFGSAGKTLRRKMVDRAEEEGWKMDDRERWSKAAQEVFSDIAADGPATPEEFDLWTKAKHYLIRLLKAMNIRIRGLLNDHDLRYYVLKTGDALKWNKLDTSARENLATQETHFEPMRASGKPRKRNNESQAQYFQRLREWERRRIAEEQDPEPQMPEIDNDAMTAEYDEYRKQWNRNHGLPEDYDDMGMPRRESGESDADYMERIRLHEAYEREMQSGDPLQPIFGWEPQAMKDWRQAYADWKRRNDIREEENVDLNLYEGNGIEPGDPITESEIDARMLRELGEATGTDTTPEGAKHHVKMAIIERRKDLESSNAEDAVFLHQLGKQIAHVAKLQGVKPEELNSALPFIIEDTYFDEIIRDENGNVIAINDISDQLPIKRTPELQSLLDTIKDWYDEFYHVLDDAGLRGKAGYIEEGYVNHVWDKEKSDPKAWEKYVEQYQRLRSPNMKQRMIESYQVGIDLGLKPKFDKLTDIMAYYSKSNNEAVANKGLMQHLSCLNIQEVNSDGEVVLNTPLLYSKQPDGLVRDRYSTFYVPGIGDIWVYKEAASKFANVFGPVTTPGEKAVSQKFWKVYDLTGSTAKKIQLSFSAFHAGALTEVFLAQGMASEGPLRALKELIRGMVYDCIRTGELPAMANPEDFKFAASHLVKLGATDDYAAADVLRLTDKFRQFASDMDKRFGMNKVGVGPLGVVGFAFDAINKGMDTLLWSYLHDGLKIRMMKMFADDLKKKAEKKGWDDDKLDKMFDEAGQYVNDCFGGQYWELIDVSPKLLKGLQRVFLSPDWLLSTMRHFFANFGFGSLYSDGGFWEYVKYNVDNLKRVFGADIPKNDFRAFRSRNAKMCYIIGVLFGAMLLSNLANAIFRKQDEEEEREKAAADPSYKSKYDLIAPDGMKWYDYLMMGNANGQTTHMFIGRYEDGTETYIRWGKQFREFPELWTNEKGELEVPWPLVKRMMGKANPNIGIILDDITYLDPYKATHQDEELQRKYGKPLGLVVKTASKFLPFIVPTQEGKEWKAIDQVFPSSKGFSKWKAQDYFKHYILTDDQQGMELTYKSCVLNGIDPQQQLDAALRSVKAAERQELADGVKDLQGAWEKFNNAQSHTEKLYWQRKLKKYLAESNYDQMNSFEFAEKAKGILGTGDEDMQPMDSKQLKEGEGIYLWLSTAEDVRDDYKVTTLYKKSGEIAKRLRQMEEDGQDTSDFEERNDHWLELRERINEYRRDLKEMKLELGGDDSESVMRRIREARSQLLKEAEELRQ